MIAPWRKLPAFYRGWPACWRWFPDPWHAVAMIGGTWYSATWERSDVPGWKIEEIA